MNIGDLRTVSYEESKTLRKQGWKPRNDVVVMMYVGRVGATVQSNKARAKALWSPEDHAFVARKMAEESKPLVIKRKHRRRSRKLAEASA